MSLRFGIRGKIALLVVAAALASAYVVARLLAASAEELVRSHELVDLGDEAQLRGWELADQVDGLREDILALRFHEGFLSAMGGGAGDSELGDLARAVCRRYWSRYLQISLVQAGAGEDGPAVRVIEEKAAIVDGGAGWMPPPEAFGGRVGGRQRALALSEVQRTRVARRNPATGAVTERWEPVIWAAAVLDRPGGEGQPPLIARMLMTLDDPQSPRHLFTLVDPRGRLLVRPDEHGDEDSLSNDAIFEGIVADEEVEQAMGWGSGGEGARQPRDDDPQVERIKLFNYLPLESRYWFLEGRPSDRLAQAIEMDDREDQDRFLEQLRVECEDLGRIGGLRGGVRELRLLAPSPEQLGELRSTVMEALAGRFGEESTRVSWRRPVECDEIHAWAIRLGLGTVDNKQDYLLIYAVLDDELASSIHQEMTALRRLAFLIALVSGGVAFMVSLFFIRPLQRMTLTAQRVAEAAPERLAGQLRRLVDHLPADRRDEVGDIARASKRLFEEVLESQEQLEKRVAERTARLAQANLDLEEANRQLKGLSREKDAFVAKISHDLRQPLNAIFLQVEALKLSPLDPQQASDVERIHHHAARELNLVNDILEYQKIIMGADRLRRDQIDATGLLAELSEAHGPAARAKGLRFAAECAPGAGGFEADRRRVRQILDNLAGNACKFTSAGEVRIEARARRVAGEDWIEFTVADTGRGMQPEEQAKAFTPFVSNKKGNEGGTGLGLSICKELCEQMGGHIGFLSEAGAGTRFTVMLPRAATSERYASLAADEEEAAGDTGGAALPSASAAAPAGQGGAEILVIDDDPGARDLMRRVLEGAGYRVSEAACGEEGVALAAARRPAAITLDIVMPGADGWEVLSRLAGQASTASIPVIMVSVMADPGDRMPPGVVECLSKPVDRERLLKVVARVAAAPAAGGSRRTDHPSQTP